VFKVCWQNATAFLFMAKRLTFVKSDGTPCTTTRGERANSGAPPVLVAFGEEDVQKLCHFGYDHGGVFIDSWHLYGGAPLFSGAAE
jgi:hypothetical protein